MSIAILGAGLTGCGAALELANRGEKVVLFERRDHPMPETSRWNEGKMHLGFIYANDPAEQSMRQMIDAALEFSGILSRWVDPGDWEAIVSPPVEYCVPADSMVSVEKIQSHFQAVEQYFLERRHQTGGNYPLWDGEPLFERVTVDQNVYEPDRVIAQFTSRERCVDTLHIADAMAEAVLAHPRIEFRPNTDILSAQTNSRNIFSISFRDHQVYTEGGFSALINALWANRTFIDNEIGASSQRSWINRFKVGVHATSSAGTIALPTTTFLLGPYGDTVRYPCGRFYFTWYPSAMFGWSAQSEYIDWKSQWEKLDKDTCAIDMVEGLTNLMPACKAELNPLSQNWVVEGGPIFAWGKSDIDDIGSQLHQRYEIGIHQHGRYLSIDTGKYTCAPLFALEAANRLSPPHKTISLAGYIRACPR